ncbi:MAG: FAD-binding oxidoreductase, partial [Myxococcota bacterium]
MTVSIWQRADGPSAHVDVAIVGGGICGVSAALEAERLGCSVLLIERGSVASGASGRNAGYLMRGMAESYSAAIERFGRERARAIWVLSEENLVALRELGAARVEGFADQPSCLLALEEQEADELEESHRLLLEDGFASELLEPPLEVDAVWKSGRPRVGLVNPADAVCHPVQLCRELASRLRADVIRAGCEVAKIEDRGDAV